MGKSSPSPPPAPDPYATASAQGSSNANTATAQTLLNNANQNTPYGTIKYATSGSYDIKNPDGSITTVPTMTMQQTLSPDQQKLLNQQEVLGFQANNAASLGLRSVNQTFQNPVTQDSLPSLTTSVGTPTLQNSYTSGQLQTGYNPGGAIQTGYDTGPALKYGYDAGGNIQTDVNLAMANTNAPTQFGATQNGVQYFQPGDFSAARDSSTNAVLQRLAPTMAAQQESLNANLANQGTAQGSAAYNAAQLSQAQANNDLRLGAVATGDAEQQALFGQQATANQLFNAAQNQDYGQQLGRGQFAQAGIAQNNAAIGQNNAATLDMGQFHNAAQNQQNTQNANAAGFYNSTVGQQNAQNAALAAFGNAAQGQQNAENAAAAGFYNSATGQQAQMNNALAAFGNTSATQDYQNRLSGGSFSNQAREQSLNDQETINNNVINQISALMHGGQVQGAPQSTYNPGTLDQTPISADVYQTAAIQNQQYQAQLQAQAQNTAAMGSAIGGIFGGLGKKSDRRLKTEVSYVARARNGLPIYAYKMVGEMPGWHFGFMADEVALVHPEAVWTDPVDGFARVDYEKAVA